MFSHLYKSVAFLVIGVCCILQSIPSASAQGLAFCYDDTETTDSNCAGPKSWGGSCNNPESKQQSPIQLPNSFSPSVVPRSIDLRMSKYRGNTFSIRNSGHTIAVKLPKSSSTNASTISLTRKEGRETTQYNLDSAHFHWGQNDSAGSEHCLKSRCFSAELHLVHIKSNFDGLESALKDSDPNTLLVIALMLEVTEKAGEGNKYLGPILENVNKITNPSADWTDVDSVLDFGPLLTTAADGKLYTYKGSLTTPDCNEKVNWYLFDKPVAVSGKDLELFRSINDARGKPLRRNNRPLQERNNRNVYSATVRQV